MKVKHYLETIANIGVFPMISLIIFTAFFAAVLWYVIKMDKSRIDQVSRIPLDNDEDNSN